MVLSRPRGFFVVGSPVAVVTMNMIATLVIGHKSGSFSISGYGKKIYIILLTLNSNCEFNS